VRDWENLRYFLAVARQGTVSGAARELAVSHSTVLRRIEQFEKLLGSKLFKKLQRGYELTTAGEQLYQEAQPIEKNIDRVLSQAEGHYDVTQGKLRISQPEIGILNIYPLYAKFKRQHPDITLEIQSTMEAHNLSQQEVDIVLRFSQHPPDLLVGRCIGTVKAKAYASKDYLKQLPKNHSSKDYDWIQWQRPKQMPSSIWFKHNITNPRIVFSTPHISDVVSAILSGIGVGFMSSHEAAKHKDLVELFDGAIIADYQLWLLTHRDLRNSERVKTFMRFMAENLILD
jgi:molybdate transport repressor ModE-like protein